MPFFRDPLDELIIALERNLPARPRQSSGMDFAKLQMQLHEALRPRNSADQVEPTPASEKPQKSLKEILQEAMARIECQQWPRGHLGVNDVVPTVLSEQFVVETWSVSEVPLSVSVAVYGGRASVG